MFCDTKVLSILLYLLLPHRNESNATCPPGQRLKYPSRSSNPCENCPNGQYSLGGTSIYCKTCSKCEKGNEVVSECTLISNTRCRCIKGFTAIDEINQMSCACKSGSGLDQTKKICQKCPFGYFSDKDDMSCQKWKDCKSGVEFQGTTTSDVVCKHATAEVTKDEKIFTTLFQTTKTTSAPTSTTKATLTNMTTSRATTTLRTTTNTPNRKSESVYIFGLVIIFAVIILVCGLLYFKSKFTRCIHNFKKVDSRKGSVCKKPVEESGGKCQSSLVHNSF